MQLVYELGTSSLHVQMAFMVNAVRVKFRISFTYAPEVAPLLVAAACGMDEGTVQPFYILEALLPDSGYIHAKIKQC